MEGPLADERARGGTAIIMAPATGDVRAVVSRPGGGFARAPLLSVPHHAGGLDDLAHELFLAIKQNNPARIQAMIPTEEELKSLDNTP